MTLHRLSWCADKGGTVFIKILMKLFVVNLALLSVCSAWAGLTVYTDGTSSPPNPAANQRTIDFDTNTLASEQAAGKLSYSTSIGACDTMFFGVCRGSGGSISYTESSSLAGFSGNVLGLTSGTTSNSTSLTINFANPTPYVGFLWGVEFNAPNSMVANVTLADNSVVTLKNCTDTVDTQCMANTVNQNWWNNVHNFLLGWLSGNATNAYSVYVQYQPSNGVKIKSIQFVVNNCGMCGFLSSNTSQDFQIDNITYVDAAVAPDHLEVTTASSSAAQGASTTFTIKACGNAACSLPYISGVTGNLSLSGTGLMATYPSGAAFTIAAGPTNSTTVVASVTPSRAATVALTGYSPAPTNATKVFCGLGVVAASGSSCSLTVLGLHHMEVTTSASSSNMNSPMIYTIKACADAACGTTYTSGVSGTLTVSGVTVSPSASQSFTIGAGSATTTVTATPTAAGAATVSLSGLSPTPSGSPAVYCGMGVAAASGNSCSLTSVQTLDHLALTATSSTNVTCTPVIYTVTACGNAACTVPYTTGLTGILTVSGVTANYPSGQTFTIGGGSSSTTISAALTSVGAATASLSGLSVTPLASPATYCGMGAAAISGGSCAVSMVNSALYFSVPNHLSDSAQTITVSAVQSSNNATVCAPAFANVSKAVTFKCTYTNPSTGTLSVQVGGVSLNAGNSTTSACDGNGQSVSLSFNASGVATTTVQYADVGQMGLTGSYAGAGSGAGLSMTGSASFVASPASFAFSGVTTSPVAGSSFSATLTAKNSSGNAVPNFGKETPPTTDYVRLTWTKYKPTGAVAVAGIFSGSGSTGSSPYISSTSFSSGAVALSNLIWTEVGVGDLSASLVGGSYLATGTAVAGSTGGTGAVGPFVPHHLDQTVLLQGCSSFTYSGQPFGITVVARNAQGGTTLNYDGTANTSPNYAKAVTLSVPTAGGSGSLSNNSISASSFGAGTAAIPVSATAPAFTFTSKLTSTTSYGIRARDSNGVTSSNGAELSIAVRSGRLKVSNAFGSEQSVLSIPVQAQYWNGKAWVINSADYCTSVPAVSVAFSNYLDNKGGSTAAWSTSASAIAISAGNGTLTLSAPSPTATGSVDFAFNLGAGGTDQSCLVNHPGSTGASLSWMRAQNGSTNSCLGVSTFDRDPSARATFGIYKPESIKTVFTRDVY